MDKKMFKIGFLTGALLVIGLGIYGYFNMRSAMTNVTVEPIELVELDLERLNGEKVLMNSGKPIVINFWATWCGPCIQEFPQFEELNKKYSDKVDFLMVSDEEISKIEKFKTKTGYTFNMIRSVKTLNNYGLTIRPATYFYNSKGTLVNQFAGGITKEELEKEIVALIEN